jgi:hypothetical protein
MLGAAQLSEGLVDGVLHAVSALVEDVDALGREVADLEAVVSLADCYVDLVGTHAGLPCCGEEDVSVVE